MQTEESIVWLEASTQNLVCKVGQAFDKEPPSRVDNWKKRQMINDKKQS